MKTVPMGARGEAEQVVKFEHTLSAHHPQLPPVYSTPDMIRLMETAAFHALQPYCEGDEITVWRQSTLNIVRPAGLARG
jgi:predicted thioesterase